jgi:ribosome-associated translation inhibitor RaiA
MQIQVNTDSSIDGHAEMATQVEAMVGGALDRFSSQITRVEIHLSDQNREKGGENDKRCMIEARLEGRPPLAVTHHANTLDQAVDGAADKLEKLIEHTLGRLRSR